MAGPDADARLKAVGLLRLRDLGGGIARLGCAACGWKAELVLAVYLGEPRIGCPVCAARREGTNG